MIGSWDLPSGAWTPEWEAHYQAVSSDLGATERTLGKSLSQKNAARLTKQWQMYANYLGKLDAARTPAPVTGAFAGLGASVASVLPGGAPAKPQAALVVVGLGVLAFFLLRR